MRQHHEGIVFGNRAGLRVADLLPNEHIQRYGRFAQQLMSSQQQQRALIIDLSVVDLRRFVREKSLISAILAIQIQHGPKCAQNVGGQGKSKRIEVVGDKRDTRSGGGRRRRHAD